VKRETRGKEKTKDKKHEKMDRKLGTRKKLGGPSKLKEKAKSLR
jgi:hypothetical protein